jgi:hypothetical protein
MASLALASPRMWSRVKIHVAADQPSSYSHCVIHNLLSRSENLDVQLELIASHGECTAQQLLSVTGAFTMAMHQWRISSLTLDLNPALQHFFNKTMAAAALVTPRLRSLSILCRPFPASCSEVPRVLPRGLVVLANSSFTPNYANIRRFSASHIYGMHHLALPWDQITHFDASGCSYEELLRILPRLQRVVEFTATNPFYNLGEELYNRSDRALQTPHPQSLKLSRLTGILDHLVPPASLQELSYSCWGHKDFVRLNEFLQSSDYPIDFLRTFSWKIQCLPGPPFGRDVLVFFDQSYANHSFKAVHRLHATTYCPTHPSYAHQPERYALRFVRRTCGHHSTGLGRFTNSSFQHDYLPLSPCHSRRGTLATT